MGSALLLFGRRLIPAAWLLLAAPLGASALGELQDAAHSTVDVPNINAVPVDNYQDRTSSGAWTLEMDASDCPRGFYPDPHPTKGPYASEADCLADLEHYKNRFDRAACEKGWRCYSSGGGAGGASAGASAIKSGVSSALEAAKALAARNNGDRGQDLLAADDGEDDGARYGRGRLRLEPKDVGRLGDGPLQVLILKLQPWCGRKLDAAEGKAARAKARRDLEALEGLIQRTRQRLEQVDTTLNQRQQAQLKIDCGELAARRLRELAREPEPTAAPAASPSPAPGTARVALLRRPEDTGGPLGHPYIDCATYKAEIAKLGSGLGVMREQLAKTKRLLSDAQAGKGEANAQARERSKDFAVGAATDIALEANKKYHALEKGVGRLMNSSKASLAAQADAKQLLRDYQEVVETSQKLVGAAKQGHALYDAGGAEAYMRSSLDGLKASYDKAWRDPAVREELLNFCGETLSDLGGPASALAYKTLKFDIDLAALSASQALDQKEIAEHQRALDVMRRELDRNEERIRFLEDEGREQCEKRP